MNFDCKVVCHIFYHFLTGTITSKVLYTKSDIHVLFNLLRVVLAVQFLQLKFQMLLVAVFSMQHMRQDVGRAGQSVENKT